MNKVKKGKTEAKQPIKIRYKKLASGSKSIYFAHWNGKWQYEFLKDLYILPETAANKEKNEETMRKVRAIHGKKVWELENQTHGFTNKSSLSKVNLLEYIYKLADKKRANAGGGKQTTAETYFSLAKHITSYCGTKTTFKHVDKRWCEEFIEHLKVVKKRNNGQSLHENTQFGYVRNFGHVLNCAILDEIITINPLKHIKPENKPKKRKTEISYLTFEEIQKLDAADFPLNKEIKQAFLFSSFLGIRGADLRRITWQQIQKGDNEVYFIRYVAGKTKKPANLPIPTKALKYLPERGKYNEAVFKIPDRSYCNKLLKFWAASAGIHKNLHWHVSRHSFATMLLSKEVPLTSVSEFLQHSEVRTTQTYAKVINQALIDAAKKMDSYFDENG